MRAVIPVENARPEFDELIELLGRCGEVVSFFLKPRPSFSPSFAGAQPLAPLFANEQFGALAEDLGAVASNPGRCSALNRFEFEGSLVALAMAGGCHRSTTDIPEARIRAVVNAGLAAAFPEPFSELHVFRLDDEKWCSATAGATIFASYVAWQSSRGLWWVLSVTDTD